MSKASKVIAGKIDSPETDGEYLRIILGEDIKGEFIICVEQCVVEGSELHKDHIMLDVDMACSLVMELTTVLGIIEKGDIDSSGGGKVH